MYGRAEWVMSEAQMGSCQFVRESNTVSFRSEDLVEPQASALAKLCAYCVFAALEFQNNATPGQVNSRKRSRRDMEGEVHTLVAVNLITVHHTVSWASLFCSLKEKNSHTRPQCCLCIPHFSFWTCWLAFMKTWCEHYVVDGYSIVIPFNYWPSVLPTLWA
jgi:uncharacterized membrane protein